MLTAALDARRLGHALPVSVELLVRVAEASLSGPDRVVEDPAWAESAVSVLCRKDSAAGLSLLLADRYSPGIGPADGVSPAPYLEQHVRREQRLEIPGKALWDAALKHSRTPDDLSALGRAAVSRWRLREGAKFLDAAAEKGDIQALRDLAWRHEDDGQYAEAERYARKLIEFGDKRTLYVMAMLRSEKRGHRTQFLKEKIRLLRGAADAGSVDACRELAYALEMFGDYDSAIPLYQSAADAGDVEALEHLARLASMRGDASGAEQLWNRAIDLGSVKALYEMASARAKNGDEDGAEELYEKAAEKGEKRARQALARIRDKKRRFTQEKANRYGLRTAYDDPEIASAIKENRAHLLKRAVAERRARLSNDYVTIYELSQTAPNGRERDRLYQLALDAGLNPVQSPNRGADREQQPRPVTSDSEIDQNSPGRNPRLEPAQVDREHLAQALNAENLPSPATLSRLVTELIRSEDYPNAERVAVLAAKMGDVAPLADIAIACASFDAREAGRVGRLVANAGHGRIFKELSSLFPRDSSLHAIAQYGLEIDGTTSHPWL
jgi:hypothetical protein